MSTALRLHSKPVVSGASGDAGSVRVFRGQFVMV